MPVQVHRRDPCKQKRSEMLVRVQCPDRYKHRPTRGLQMGLQQSTGNQDIAKRHSATPRISPGACRWRFASDCKSISSKEPSAGPSGYRQRNIALCFRPGRLASYCLRWVISIMNRQYDNGVITRMKNGLQIPGSRLSVEHRRYENLVKPATEDCRNRYCTALYCG